MRIAAATILSLLTLPAIGWAHAVVHPARSTPAAYERYLVRVPNEREASTTRIAITFPAGLRVISFGDVPGWTVEVLRGGDGGITGAAWTGRLEAERFVELPFIGVNPSNEVTLSWPVTQEYENGEVVEWVGAEGSDAPASTTVIGTSEEETSGAAGLYLGGAGVVLGLIALGLTLRKNAPSTV